MTADFDRLTSGNRQTDELKSWVRWLFRKLKRSLADPPEPPAVPQDVVATAPTPPLSPPENVGEVTPTPIEETEAVPLPSETPSVAAPSL